MCTAGQQRSPRGRHSRSVSYDIKVSYNYRETNWNINFTSWLPFRRRGQGNNLGADRFVQPNTFHLPRKVDHKINDRGSVGQAINCLMAQWRIPKIY